MENQAPAYAMISQPVIQQSRKVQVFPLSA